MGSSAYRSPENSSLNIRTTSLKVILRHLQTVVQLLSKPLSRRLTEDEENFQRIKGVWIALVHFFGIERCGGSGWQSSLNVLLVTCSMLPRKCSRMYLDKAFRFQYV